MPHTLFRNCVFGKIKHFQILALGEKSQVVVIDAGAGENKPLEYKDMSQHFKISFGYLLQLPKIGYMRVSAACPILFG